MHLVSVPTGHEADSPYTVRKQGRVCLRRRFGRIKLNNPLASQSNLPFCVATFMAVMSGTSEGVGYSYRLQTCLLGRFSMNRQQQGPLLVVNGTGSLYQTMCSFGTPSRTLIRTG